MIRRTLLFTASILVALGFLFSPKVVQAAAEKRKVLLVVLDGLRPDYITPELMPNLHAFGKAGIVAERHHSVFPSVTRVNASSIATGSYPAAHGILQNTIFLPLISTNKIDTSDATELLEVEKNTDGRLLTATSLGELLEKNGKRLFVAGSSSTGTSLLLNHKVTGDGIWNSRSFVLPSENTEGAEKLLGPFPKFVKPHLKGNRWAIRAVLEHAGQTNSPDAMILWITDPDDVAHEHGVGSPDTLKAIRHVDQEFGYLLEGLNALGLKNQINLFVSTDHGFSTYTGGFNLKKLLSAHGLDKDVTVVANQIYVKDRNRDQIRSIVHLLHGQEWVGAIFTHASKPGIATGFVPGTLSFDLIHWNHDRSADILVDANWTSGTNAFGYAGTTSSSGTAGHGTTSPFDLKIRLLASGPDLKRGVRSEVPSGNIDLAPTILHVLGIEPPAAMDGRILTELLRNGPSPETVKSEETTHQSTRIDSEITYKVQLKRISVGKTDYIDSTHVRRK